MNSDKHTRQNIYLCFSLTKHVIFIVKINQSLLNHVIGSLSISIGNLQSNKATQVVAYRLSIFKYRLNFIKLSSFMHTFISKIYHFLSFSIIFDYFGFRFIRAYFSNLSPSIPRYH